MWAAKRQTRYLEKETEIWELEQKVISYSTVLREEPKRRRGLIFGGARGEGFRERWRKTRGNPKDNSVPMKSKMKPTGAKQRGRITPFCTLT